MLRSNSALALAESSEVAGGVPADLWAGDREDLRAVRGAHHLPAPCGDPGREQHPVEVDAFVAQRVALVHADHSRREPLNVLSGRERRPGTRIALGEGLDSV